MKTFNRILVLFTVIACLTACSKKEADPAPELSARISGDYKVTYLKQDGKTFTLNGSTKGTIKVSAESAEMAQVIVDVSNGNPSDDIKGVINNIALKDIGGGEVELIANGFTLGKGGNNQITVKVAPVDGSAPYEFIGIK
ncbi:hypothetical protein [Dyadobacter arcticus]|uniref:Lipoprotein YajG n=1 Tax=Dyadobacter arcticus TaxID=1078754 RepID=A0ABX0UED6_9BACT|nr:hypothetical protein [Dyadobacter arcticus]NIJ51007.1 putative lipoprotein YajG [Dyadobacter arcticus]